MKYVTMNRNGSRDLMDLMDGMLEEFWQGAETRSKSRSPLVDIRNEKDSYLLLAELPGVIEENLDLKIEKDILSLKAEAVSDKDDQGDFLLRERNNRTFSRDFRVPEDVDAEKIEAKFRNGILEIRLPKMEEKKPRNIKIKVA